MNIVVLETDRLILRQFTFEDAPFIVSLLNEASYIRNIGDKKVRTLDDAKHHILTGPMESYKKMMTLPDTQKDVKLYLSDFTILN